MARFIRWIRAVGVVWEHEAQQDARARAPAPAGVHCTLIDIGDPPGLLPGFSLLPGAAK
jgi:hypothetical protein